MKTFISSLAVLAVCMMVSQASASPVTLTSTETQPFNIGAGGLATPLTFNSFDTSLGTLQQVTITFDVTVASGSFIVDNDGATATDATVDASIDAQVATGGEVVFTPIPFNSTTHEVLNLGPDDGDGAGSIDGSAPDGAIISFAGAHDVLQAIVNSGIGLASFEDTNAGADYIVNLSATSSIDTHGNNDVAGGWNPMTLSGNVKVEYTYIPTPEPTTLAFLALGFVGFGRRRR